MATTKKSKAEKQAELNSVNKPKAIYEAPEDTAPLNEGEADVVASEEPAVAKKKGNDKIKQIINHFISGKSIKLISSLPVLNASGEKIVIGQDDAGNDIYETFHPTTVSIQINRYKDAHPDEYPVEFPGKTRSEVAAEKKAISKKQKFEESQKRLEERQKKDEDKIQNLIAKKEEKDKKNKEKAEKYKLFLIEQGILKQEDLTKETEATV